MNATARTDPSQSPVCGRAKILVINDAPDFLSFMRDVLSTEGGYEVATLDQSEGCIEQISSTPPDLIILDIVFRRGPSGLDVADHLAASAATTGIPVLFCTALSERDLAREILDRIRSRQQRILYKPFDIDDLLRIVAELLRPVDDPAVSSVI